jgi:hypothetical protein
MKTVAFTLGALGLLTGVAWADPSGEANIRQILNGGTFLGPSPTATTQQRTFLTTDPIIVGATYYDPADACAGVAPTTVKFFVFNLEGQLVLGKNRDTTGGVVNAPLALASKYQGLRADLAPGELPAGSYNLVFRVESCSPPPTSVLVSGFYSFRVIAPPAPPIF